MKPFSEDRSKTDFMLSGLRPHPRSKQLVASAVIVRQKTQLELVGVFCSSLATFGVGLNRIRYEAKLFPFLKFFGGL